MKLHRFEEQVAACTAIQVDEYEATISRLTAEAAEQQAELMHRRAAMEELEPVATVRAPDTLLPECAIDLLAASWKRPEIWDLLTHCQLLHNQSGSRPDSGCAVRNVF